MPKSFTPGIQKTHFGIRQISTGLLLTRTDGSYSCKLQETRGSFYVSKKHAQNLLMDFVKESSYSNNPIPTDDLEIIELVISAQIKEKVRVSIEPKCPSLKDQFKVVNSGGYAKILFADEGISALFDETVFEKVKTVLSDCLWVEKDHLKRGFTFDQMGCDSLDLIEFVMALEEEFEIVLTDEETEKFYTMTLLDISIFMAAKIRGF